MPMVIALLDEDSLDREGLIGFLRGVSSSDLKIGLGKELCTVGVSRVDVLWDLTEVERKGQPLSIFVDPSVTRRNDRARPLRTFMNSHRQKFSYRLRAP